MPATDTVHPLMSAVGSFGLSWTVRFPPIVPLIPTDAEGLEAWTGPDIDRLNAMGDRLRREGNQAFADAGEPGQLAGDGSLFRIILTSDRITNYRSAVRNAQPASRMAELHRRLMESGIIIGKAGLGCLSPPMTETDVDHFLAALKQSLAGMN